ncbi:Thioredoxin-like fold [Ostreococcus tauri]|uniref:Thioredoxin-like fold n=1 Tax=Ostreococcus tauri TaxID=70448 RepID=A0A090N3H5_OSTTA|nr:Thioredoxin-like fold [Ostreococcus tauri]CEF98128.1 Thioredoxin-like fold [Ostreococcus tauri]|eukprot:XP_003079542.2 Thioredoxin-like fold [Ostreococcus tauri]
MSLAVKAPCGRVARARGRRHACRASAPTLYGSPGSRSPLVNWYCHEIGLDVRARAPNDPSNPHPFGQVPALEDDGLTVFESGAILMYLADAYGGMDDAKKRAEAAAWVVWANATLDGVLFIENERGGVVDTGAKNPNQKRLRRLDDILREREFLVGDAWGVADCAVAAYLLYVPQFFPRVSWAPYPNIARYMGRNCARDAYARAFGADVRAGIVDKLERDLASR